MTLLLAILAAPAIAGSALEGDTMKLYYNAGGTWNDSAVGSGLQALLGDSWTEFTYAGIAYQAVSVEYTVGEGEDTEERAYYANSSLGNTLTVGAGTDQTSGDILRMEWTYEAGDLALVKTESFDRSGYAITVSIGVTNEGTSAAHALRVLYTLDPDQDATAYEDYTTDNDVLDLDADGVSDWVEALGPTSGAAIAFGACTPGNSELGFWPDWQTSTNTDVPLTDPETVASDEAMALRYSDPVDLAPGETHTFTFVISVGADSRQAALEFDAAADVCCDGDVDGEDSLACGGADCDDTNPDLNPAATDVAYDGIDQDCSGTDYNDLDGDGEVGAEAGGTDCDDTNDRVSTMAAEIWYDGVDENCDGNDDDQDFDGAVLAYDCDDLDPTIQTDCPEPDTGKGGAVNADPGGCGCSTGGNGAGVIAGFAGAVLATRRRR